MVNKIHLAFIQETMLKTTDKLYIKGFKIYRAYSNFRKGTMILVSNLVDAQSNITSHSEEGRYLKVKLKNETHMLSQINKKFLTKLSPQTYSNLI